MKNEWFIIDEASKTFRSKRIARTKTEAWDKTLLNWGLRMSGYVPSPPDDVCGMCNIDDLRIENNDEYKDCSACILNTERWCIPFSASSDLQYLWLLFVREAVNNPAWEEK